MKTIQIGNDIQARQKDSGTWEIKHPGQEGKMTRWYSSGITGTERQLRHHIKEQKIEDIVAIGQRGALTDKVLAQFQRGSPKSIKLEAVSQEWFQWMRRVGESPRTIEQYQTYFDMWVRDQRLAKVPVSEIGFEQIDPFVNPDSAIKHATRQSRLNMIRSLYKFMIAQNYCGGNPSALVRVNMDMLTHAQKERKQIDPFTKAEVKRILSYAGQEIDRCQALIRDQGNGSASSQSGRAIRKPFSRMRWMEFWQFAVVASYEVGLRLGDICTLEWQSFADPGSIIVWTDKREKRVALPVKEFAPWLADAIDQLPCNDLTYCFPEIREAYQGSRSTVSANFLRLLQDVGLEGRSFHSLRHTAIRRMQREGKTLEEIGKLVAHASPETTKGYLG